jgi:adenylyltransferase/sulfurtransferase
MISRIEKNRYQRQLIMKGWGMKTQEKLKKARVFVAGTGGLGSPLLMYLAAAGVGKIAMCDNDTVDLSNLNRQVLHSDSRIGMRKADSAMKILHDINPHVELVPLYETITGKNASSLMADADLIIDCLDNFRTRHLLNEVSVKSGIPMIHAGVSGLQGQITFLQPPDTPCLACFYPSKAGKEVFPILGASAGVIGTLQAMEAIKYLTGMGNTLKNRLLFWDGARMIFETIKIARDPDCRVCKGAVPSGQK